jgi:hypothetical protein
MSILIVLFGRELRDFSHKPGMIHHDLAETATFIPKRLASIQKYAPSIHLQLAENAAIAASPSRDNKRQPHALVMRPLDVAGKRARAWT